MSKKIFVITGPTASGKTKLSIALAKKLNAEIICSDSRIIYKNFDIVSAKPTIEERENIPHHLIDIIDANCEFSAGDFVKYAQKIIEEQFNLDKDVIISGGTWFYIKSLLDETTLPKCSINKKLREELENLSKEELYKKLLKLDSKRASLIHPNNKDKIIRSIELCLELNQPLSEYIRSENKKYNVSWYMLNCEREELYKRINSRVDKMIGLGLIEEWLKNSRKYPNSKILKNTIGYSELFDFKNGNYPTIEFAIDKIKQHARNFAKRQLTYFKSNKDIKLIKNLEDITIEF